MAHFIIDIDSEGPTTRLVEAKTRAQALQFVAQGIITVRIATAADLYDLARKGVAREDANAVAAGQAAP